MENLRCPLRVKKNWVAGALGLCLIMSAASAMAIETPDYKVVVKQGAFEVRDYAAQTVAEVVVEGDQQDAVRNGFRRLASYIFGANSGDQKIAMTAPVAQSPVMSGPVTTSALGAQRWVVRFDMPRAHDLSTLPKPKNAAIRLLTLPPARIAAVRFSGLMSDSAAAKETAELLGYIKTSGLKAAGPPTLAQYDPPWTLWFLRRNEVLIPVAQGST